MPKIIYITEEQEPFLLEQMVLEELQNLQKEKVLLIKKFLDNNFKRADISSINSDGYNEHKPIVVYLDSYKQPIKNLSDQDLLDMLLDKFQDIIKDEQEKKSFLTKVMKNWYNNNKKLDLGIID